LFLSLHFFHFVSLFSLHFLFVSHVCFASKQNKPLCFASKRK
jgi:hypothetical protein